MKFESIESLVEVKRQAKKVLTENLFGRVQDGALLGIFIEEELNGEEQTRILKLIEGLESVNVNVLILSDCSFSEKIPQKNLLNYSRKNRKDLLEACDMALVLSFTDVEELIVNGVVPVGRAADLVVDYNPNRETGTGFVYQNPNEWAIFAALVRANETFRFPYDWKHIISNSRRLLEQ